jgi:hypothetical protein
MEVEDFADDLPLAVRFQQRKHVGEFVTGPVVEFDSSDGPKIVNAVPIWLALVERLHNGRVGCLKRSSNVYLKSLIMTTSRSSGPRESASHLPSRDQSNEKIRSDLKSVNCRAGLSSSGWIQMFETPPRLTI